MSDTVSGEEDGPVRSGASGTRARRSSGVVPHVLLVLLVVGVVGAGALTAIGIKDREAVGRHPASASHSTTPSPRAAGSVNGPTIAVIGDAATGAAPATSWAAALMSAVDGTLDHQVSAGMGYVARGASGETFVTAAAKVPRTAEVVIFISGVEDSARPALELAKLETGAFAAARQRAPEAKVIVVGPLRTAGTAVPEVTAFRRTLQASAAIAGAVWVDPIRLGWLSAAGQADASALTTGEQHMVGFRLADVVRTALA